MLATKKQLRKAKIVLQREKFKRTIHYQLLYFIEKIKYKLFIHKYRNHNKNVIYNSDYIMQKILYHYDKNK